VSADDVRKGAAHDCYFASAMASVANERPEVIRNAIKDNKDGTYTVTFYNDGNKSDKVEITVDSQLYVDSSGNLKYSRGVDKNADGKSDELWPAIMEKAYAKWKGGYDAIGNGTDDVAMAISEITGKDATYTYTDTSRSSQFYSIRNALRNDRPVTAGTFGGEKDEKYDSNGLTAHHVYSVLDAYREDGKKYIVLRDPNMRSRFEAPYHTEADWDRNGAIDSREESDGIFQMTFEDFQRNFKSYSIEER
jgi:hypothetical protein